MKKILTILLIAFIGIAFAGQLLVLKPRTKKRITGTATAADTFSIDNRGGTPIMFFYKADTFGAGTGQLSFITKWEYSPDGTNWYTGATIRDTVKVSVGAFVMDSVVEARCACYPFIRHITTGKRATTDCRFTTIYSVLK
jgi:hypothetical protein